MNQPTENPSPRTRDRAVVESAVKAYDVRGIVEPYPNAVLDEAFVFDAGAAFASILREEGETTIAVGYDMRPSSPALSAAFGEGVMSQGLNVLDLGPVSYTHLTLPTTF